MTQQTTYPTDRPLTGDEMYAIVKGAVDAGDLTRAVKLAPEVLECHMVAGGFDYLVKARLPDMAAYRRFLGETLLSMPGVRETRTYAVMEEIKRDEALKRIPVVVLTTSKAEEDVLRTYNLHANCYVTKPVDLEKFIHVVQSIDRFWLTVVTLPPADR